MSTVRHESGPDAGAAQRLPGDAGPHLPDAALHEDEHRHEEDRDE